jgi:exopolysaccharide production protein ExoY
MKTEHLLVTGGAGGFAGTPLVPEYSASLAVRTKLGKRLIDLTGAAILLILLSPLFLAIAFLIKITSGGPVLFRQERVGLGGKRFRCLKFRTMIVDAERELQKHLAVSEEARREWGSIQKLTRDPRVTRLGRFLRTTSLDELPQLVHVLAGEMSLVGPRPIIPAEMQRYGENLQYYLAVRPGMTGLWQVTARNTCSYAERVNLDTSYVLNWSLVTDVIILFRTVPAVFVRPGS